MTHDMVYCLVCNVPMNCNTDITDNSVSYRSPKCGSPKHVMFIPGSKVLKEKT